MSADPEINSIAADLSEHERQLILPKKLVVLDKAENFKSKLQEKLHSNFQRERKLEEQKLTMLNDLQNKLDTLDQLQARANCGNQVESGGSGDKIRKYDATKGMNEIQGLIPLNQPDDLTSICLQFTDTSTKSGLSELSFRGLHVVRHNTVLNKKTSVLVKNKAHVAYIFFGVEDEKHKQFNVPVNTGIGATPREAFKSVVDEAYEQFTRIVQVRGGVDNQNAD